MEVLEILIFQFLQGFSYKLNKIYLKLQKSAKS